MYCICSMPIDSVSRAPATPLPSPLRGASPCQYPSKCSLLRGGSMHQAYLIPSALPSAMNCSSKFTVDSNMSPISTSGSWCHYLLHRHCLGNGSVLMQRNQMWAVPLLGFHGSEAAWEEVGERNGLQSQESWGRRSDIAKVGR